MLTRSQLETICLINGPAHLRCRYIGQADGDPGTYLCNKLSRNKKDIDQEVEHDLKRMQEDGKNPEDENTPLGDNCSGYPILYNLPQGVDVDKKLRRP